MKFFAYEKNTGRVIGFSGEIPTNDYLSDDEVKFGDNSLKGFVSQGNIGFWENETGIEVDTDYEYIYDPDTNELTKGELKEEI